MDKLYNALSLARKAGALTFGFDAVCQLLDVGRAPLLMVAADTAAGTQRRLGVSAAGQNIYRLPYTQQELAPLAGKPAGVLAVADKNLAGLVKEALAQGAPSPGGAKTD